MKLQLTQNIALSTNNNNIAIKRAYITYAADPRTVTDTEIQQAQHVAEQALNVRFNGFVRPFCDSRQTTEYWQ